MAAAVIIIDGPGLRIEAHHGNQPNKSKLLLYKLFFFILTFLSNGCTEASRRSASVMKMGVVGVGICVLRCLKEELA